MRRVLVVANETAGESHLRDEMRSRMDREPHEFILLVPAKRPHGKATWTEGEARQVARERMDAAIEEMTAMGAIVTGDVGVAPTEFDCVMDALRTASYDEIIISTLPHHISHWLRMDLPDRVARNTAIPVTHVASRSGKHSAA